MLQYEEKISQWLAKSPLPIDEGGVANALTTVGILGGWTEFPLGLSENKLYVIYVVASDADPHALVEVGFVGGKDMKKLEEELKGKFQIQRGVDSKWSGVYFWLIPATSEVEAYQLSCAIWHTYLRAKSSETHPRSSADNPLLCPYSDCDWS